MIKTNINKLFGKQIFKPKELRFKQLEYEFIPCADGGHHTSFSIFAYNDFHIEIFPEDNFHLLSEETKQEILKPFREAKPVPFKYRGE